jgi:hypothetical protein
MLSEFGSDTPVIAGIKTKLERNDVKFAISSMDRIPLVE